MTIPADQSLAKTQLKRRDQVLDYMMRFAENTGGNSPTIRQIALAFNLSYTTVYRHVNRLEDEGKIQWKFGKYKIMGATWNRPPSDFSPRGK